MVQSETESGELYRGVRAIEHTADVAIEVTAPTLEQLFDRAAHGTFAMIAGADEIEPGSHAEGSPPGEESSDHRSREERVLALAADDLAGLLALWLRELLFLHEVRGLAYIGARFASIDGRHLSATVGLGRDPRPPVREIKGVTYHGLSAARENDTWRARIIFDV